ncbi:MAG: hypothetical protein GXY34_05175 [Syntrophomonadaceae bacterium]|nr:hypothetical protein [Syntrophomonadaceae bacterium]
MDRIGRSVDNLFMVIEDLRISNQRLTSLIYQLIGGHATMARNATIINNPTDLLDYLGEYENDYTLFVTPGTPIAYLERDEIDRMSERGTLGAWIESNWLPETIAIAVP